MKTYTSFIGQATTFPTRFAAQEAIAELDGCEVGHCVNHRINQRGDGKIILVRWDQTYFADNIGNQYSSQLNDERSK